MKEATFKKIEKILRKDGFTLVRIMFVDDNKTHHSLWDFVSTDYLENNYNREKYEYLNRKRNKL